MKALSFLLGFGSLALAAPQVKRATAPTVTIKSPAATIIGASQASIDSFSGIPFALPPTGSLRLRPPTALTSALGTVTATASARSCPQFDLDTDFSSFPTNVAGILLDLPIFQIATNAGEDCLTLDIARPAGTTSKSALPVLVYIFGGGFELGASNTYNGQSLLTEAISEGKPFVYVAMNYRIGGFGFLPGSEILADGASNLGLLDQRLALEWVADNIAAFGGDPTKVTISGESAGAISVFDQMALYDGDNTYKGQPLFRAAIMDSGSIVPANPVNCPKGQAVFDTVAEHAGCSGASDKLACLRALDYTTFLNAANSVPGIISYSSLALSYLPRPDGTVLTQSPDLLVEAGKFAKVPFIIGDQQDEGTLFSLVQTNLTTTQDLVNYFHTVFFPQADVSVIEGLVAQYPDDPTAGSPFNTFYFNELYPQFKRLAAILGDITFTLTRRTFLNTTSAVSSAPSWSYLASYDYGTPILGTFHGSDVLQVIFGIVPDYASRAFRAYYYSFIYHLDPNTDSGYTNWPQWSQGNQIIQMNTLQSELVADNFRSGAYNYLIANVKNFYI